MPSNIKYLIDTDVNPFRREEDIKHLVLNQHRILPVIKHPQRENLHIFVNKNLYNPSNNHLSHPFKISFHQKHVHNQHNSDHLFHKTKNKVIGYTMKRNNFQHLLSKIQHLHQSQKKISNYSKGSKQVPVYFPQAQRSPVVIDPVVHQVDQEMRK